MKLNYSNGSYNLSFFNIEIETDERLTPDVMEKNRPTFVHEFVHYLQDLILPYNIRHNLSYVRFFYNILEAAHRNASIALPFQGWDHESQNLDVQISNSFGGMKDNGANGSVDFVSKIGEPTSDYEIISGFDGHLQKNRTHRVYQYSLPVYEPGSPCPIDYDLGARDLLEYIAYKIELKHFPDRPPAPQLPYESVDLLFAHYGLSHISDDIRLCIAECCLYNDAPIHFLLHILIGDEGFRQFITNSSYEEIYKRLLKLEFVTRDGHRERLIDKTQRRLKQFTDELGEQYRGFDEIRSWLLKVNDFAEGELFGRFIFADMYRMEKDEFDRFIHSVIRRIGVPLVMNLKKECVSLQANEKDVSQFVQFYILQRFIQFVSSDSWECPICDFCKGNGGVCSENCTHDFRIAIEENQDCYFSRFLKSYGLSDIAFV